MMPLSLPIIAPPPSASMRRSGGDAHGVTAIASASAASCVGGSAFGSSTPSIRRICSFSLWPAPTMVFFTRLGAYSATEMPGARRNQHGDAARLAELERRVGVLVDEGRLDRRLVGRELLDHLDEPVVDRDQPLGERDLVAGRDRAAGDVRSGGCPRPRSGPSRCGGAPDRCRGCESGGPWCPVDRPAGRCGKAPAWRLPILLNRVHGGRLLDKPGRNPNQ